MRVEYRSSPLDWAVWFWIIYFGSYATVIFGNASSPCAMWVASPWGFSEMTTQPARHECHACCPLQAEKPGIQPVVSNTHDAHVEQVVSSFQKTLRGSQLMHMVQLCRALARNPGAIILNTRKNKILSSERITVILINTAVNCANITK